MPINGSVMDWHPNIRHPNGGTELSQVPKCPGAQTVSAQMDVLLCSGSSSSSNSCCCCCCCDGGGVGTHFLLSFSIFWLPKHSRSTGNRPQVPKIAYVRDNRSSCDTIDQLKSQSNPSVVS